MKKVIILLVIFLCVFKTNAQQEVMVSQYMFNGLYLNPAYAGSHEYWTSTLTYRNQWVGLEGAPTTVIAAVDGPIPGKNMGLGLVFFNDQIGVTRQNTVVFNYSYQIKTSKTTKLALGVNAGFSQFSAKLTDLTVWDQDQVFQNDITSKILPKFGVGMYYYSKRHYVGFSKQRYAAFCLTKSSINRNKALAYRLVYGCNGMRPYMNWRIVACALFAGAALFSQRI